MLIPFADRKRFAPTIISGGKEKIGMRKMISGFMAALLLASSMFSADVMALELPDLGELASEAASGISDAAQKAGETAEHVKEKLTEAGVKIKVSAGQLGEATAQKASELTEKAGKNVDDAVGAVSDAADYVLDQAGNVIDLASSGADEVSTSAKEALEALRKYGSLFMKLARAAVSGMDLSDPESWEPAKDKVEKAIRSAYQLGLIDEDTVSKETMGIVVDIVFETMIYGYQYSQEEITLGELVAKESELLIRKGLPVGVGYLVSLLPVNIPNADRLAKEAVYFLIAAAYGEEPVDASVYGPADETEPAETAG